MSVGRSLFIVFAFGAALLLVAPSASVAQEPVSTDGSPAQVAQGMDLQQQVGDTTDDVDDTAEDAQDQVGDAADDAQDQVGDAADDAQDQVEGTVDDAGSQVNNTAGEAEREVNGGAAEATGEVVGDGSTSQATNSNPASGSDAGEIAGAGNEVSDASSDETGKGASAGEAAPSPGLLSLTGTRGLIFAVVVGVLLIGLGVFLVSLRRRRRRSVTV